MTTSEIIKNFQNFLNFAKFAKNVKIGQSLKKVIFALITDRAKLMSNMT